jgi:hypothetical protein
MNIEEFRDNVDLYSADLSRWPRDRVRPALALVEASPEARACFDAALALDDLLRHGVPRAHADLDALEDRIMAAVAVKHAVTPSLFSLAGRAMLGLFVAAVLGFMAGFGHRAEARDLLLDPVFYAQDQVISGDDVIINQQEIYE